MVEISEASFPDSANESMKHWFDFLELDNNLHREKGIHLLTPEARVLIILTLKGPRPVNSAMQMAGTSARGFYSVLERLKQAGLITVTRDAVDQRVRRLSIKITVQNSPATS